MPETARGIDRLLGGELEGHLHAGVMPMISASVALRSLVLANCRMSASPEARPLSFVKPVSIRLERDSEATIP